MKIQFYYGYSRYNLKFLDKLYKDKEKKHTHKLNKFEF